MPAVIKRARRKARRRPPWGKLLDGNPIQDLGRNIRLQKLGDESEEDRTKTEKQLHDKTGADARRHQFHKMLLVKKHYGIKGESGWSPWYNLALAIASDLDDSLKIIDPIPKRASKTAPRWRGSHGVQLIAEVAAFRKVYSNEKMLATLDRLREIAPERYGRFSRNELEKNYYEARRHTTKQTKSKPIAS
jgi:hypothetical protein